MKRSEGRSVLLRYVEVQVSESSIMLLGFPSQRKTEVLYTYVPSWHLDDGTRRIQFKSAILVTLYPTSLHFTSTPTLTCPVNAFAFPFQYSSSYPNQLGHLLITLFLVKTTQVIKVICHVIQVWSYLIWKLYVAIKWWSVMMDGRMLIALVVSTYVAWDVKPSVWIYENYERHKPLPSNHDLVNPA